MRADPEKNNPVTLLNKNCPIIARDVDASGTREYPTDSVIVEQRMQRFPYKKVFSFHKPHANVFRQLLVLLKKQAVKFDFHANSSEREKILVHLCGILERYEILPLFHVTKRRAKLSRGF